MGLIKQIVVTDTMLKQAQNKATEMGALNNSILKGDGNLTGFLGELISLEVLHGKQHNTYEYDIVLDNGKTVDVKSKKTKVAPKPHYECSVAAFNIKQKCDLYCFVRVKDDYSCGWFLGVYPKQKYYEDAVFLRKGQVDKLNNYTVKADCYNLQIVNLLDSAE